MVVEQRCQTPLEGVVRSRRAIDGDPRLVLGVEGAGEIEASGSVGDLTATIKGAGDANLAGLRARTARITVQGAGDADLNVTEQLDVTVQGAGDVSYRGDPTVRSEIQGAGDISREP